MLIDDSVVLGYLNGEEGNNICSHWVFQSIEEGKSLFEAPDVTKRDEVNKILHSIKRILLDFIPLNEEIYSNLFPEWKLILENMNVMLIVGCPSPYDAMLRKYNEKEYIIFDLLRFHDYVTQGYDIDMLVRQLVTHEAAHLCLHRKYPVPTTEDFLKQLKYIVFDEGFAHLLSYKINIREFDFVPIINEKYNEAFRKLKDAMIETDIQKQKILLEQCNSGPYWEKFACISGKLYLAGNLANIDKIYNNGINNFISCMGL